MKRTPSHKRSSFRSSDPFENLSTEQLSYIGAIALLYNDVEALVDTLCSLALHITIRPQELTSRINGMDGKIELIKLGARHWGFNASEMTLLEDLLGKGGFKLMKTWRDAVIHCQIVDAPTALARVHERQGRVSDVLLSIDALKGFYNRLDLMRVELISMRDILSAKQMLQREALKEFQFELDDQDKEQLERGIQLDWAQAQEHRSQRLKLPPIPEFPPDTPDPEWFQRLQESLAAVLPESAGLS
jgi:hypothetical protein